MPSTPIALDSPTEVYFSLPFCATCLTYPFSFHLIIPAIPRSPSLCSWRYSAVSVYFSFLVRISVTEEVVTQHKEAALRTGLVTKWWEKIIHTHTHTRARVGDRGSTVVKVLCYKSEGRRFDSRLEFFIDVILPIALRPWGRLSL